MTTITCPSREELKAFANGEVDDQQFSFVSEHLTDCDDCEATIAELENDPDSIVEMLRSSRAMPEIDEPEFQQAMQHIETRPAPPGNDETADRQLPVDVAADIHEYELLGAIGQGGMGMVYRARHRKLGHLVALKCLPIHRRSHLASAQRFEREIAAVGKLHHPNIVKAYDAGQADDTHFLVMELIHGVNLHQLVKQLGPLPVPDACEIVRQTALGLQHAHEHGLVHRDLKPSNILLSRDGDVKLLDLGLALLHEENPDREDLTDTGQVMGTLDYMSPEQATDSHRVDHRSDLYAIGCTLFKLLTGHAPFSGRPYQSPAKKILAHATQAPPNLIDLRHDIPKPLDVLARQLLGKSPQQRPASAAEVADLLAPFAQASDLVALATHIEVLPDCDTPGASATEIPVRFGQSTLNDAFSRMTHRVPRRPMVAIALLLIFAIVAGAAIITIKRGDDKIVELEVPEKTRIKVDDQDRITVELPQTAVLRGIGEPKAESVKEDRADDGSQLNAAKKAASSKDTSIEGVVLVAKKAGEESDATVVELSLGTHDGLRNGDDVDIFRGNECVGRVSIVRMLNTRRTFGVVQYGQAQKGDVAKASRAEGSAKPLPSYQISLMEAESIVLKLDNDVARYSIADTSVSTINQQGPNWLRLVAKLPGSTALNIWDGHNVSTYFIRVEPTASEQATASTTRDGKDTSLSDKLKSEMEQVFRMMDKRMQEKPESSLELLHRLRASVLYHAGFTRRARQETLQKMDASIRKAQASLGEPFRIVRWNEQRTDERSSNSQQPFVAGPPNDRRQTLTVWPLRENRFGQTLPPEPFGPHGESLAFCSGGLHLARSNWGSFTFPELTIDEVVPLFGHLYRAPQGLSLPSFYAW
jgi:serine/threonine protein kinase